jgi:hypothetical protein
MDGFVKNGFTDNPRLISTIFAPMPSAPIKDYYKILELTPDATAEEVKKAYRALAFKYHPDTNTDNAFAAGYFIEIQEAYSILSFEDKRRKYDEERWLSGMSKRAKDTPLITPEWIWQEAKKLRLHMDTVDTYRMSHSALNDYVMLLLSDSHMAVLKQSNDNATCQLIVQQLLLSTRHLKYQYMLPVCNRLALLVPDDSVMLAAIYQQQRHSYRQALWEKYLPAFIVAITLLLCVIMYFYSRH